VCTNTSKETAETRGMTAMRETVGGSTTRSTAMEISARAEATIVDPVREYGSTTNAITVTIPDPVRQPR
jgi:hypothetical protein